MNLMIILASIIGVPTQGLAPFLRLPHLSLLCSRNSESPRTPSNFSSLFPLYREECIAKRRSLYPGAEDVLYAAMLCSR